MAPRSGADSLVDFLAPQSPTASAGRRPPPASAGAHRDAARLIGRRLLRPGPRSARGRVATKSPGRDPRRRGVDRAVVGADLRRRPRGHRSSARASRRASAAAARAIFAGAALAASGAEPRAPRRRRSWTRHSRGLAGQRREFNFLFDRRLEFFFWSLTRPPPSATRPTVYVPHTTFWATGLASRAVDWADAIGAITPCELPRLDDQGDAYSQGLPSIGPCRLRRRPDPRSRECSASAPSRPLGRVLGQRRAPRAAPSSSTPRRTRAPRRSTSPIGHGHVLRQLHGNWIKSADCETAGLEDDQDGGQLHLPEDHVRARTPRLRGDAPLPPLTRDRRRLP